MHAWLPDAHAEGPTPISAVLSGLLLNVALYAILRFKMLVAANQNAWAPGHADDRRWACLAGFRRFMLYRRRDIKRLFAYSSIEHMGIVDIRVRHRRPAGEFRRPAAHDDAQPDQIRDLLRGRPCRAGQGHAAHRRNPRSDRHHPILGWGLVLGVVAIAGMPPLGLFMSEFLVISTTFAREPWLAVPLVGGLLIALGALSCASARWRSASRRPGRPPVHASYVPLFAHLALVLVAGHLSAGPDGRLVRARRRAARDDGRDV